MGSLKRENADNADRVRCDLCANNISETSGGAMDCAREEAGLPCKFRAIHNKPICEACGKEAELHPDTGYCQECMDT